ncbi:MAG: hypothetical protein CMO04_19590, partial [Thalassospira sp.]|uniref:hypothetical protein n=1 Tax=Thalassospira sp. TaxID=1912094 RepID=UPI000C5D5BD3
PTRTTLLAIAVAANVSLDWLITGSGSKSAINSVESAEKRTTALDQDLLAMVIEELETFREERNLKWDIQQKSRLITLGYDMMLAEREKGNSVGRDTLHYLMQAAS